MGATEIVDRLVSAVPYLRISVGDNREPIEWWSCESLVEDPEALIDLARSTASGRGTDQDQVAISLFVQGYAFRIASVAIGGWLLDDAVVDVAPARTSIALGRSRPNAVHFDSLTVATAEEPLAALHEQLIENHLARLVANAHRACRVGEALLWANVAAACASSFQAFDEKMAPGSRGVPSRVERFFSSGRPELIAAGHARAVGEDWVWERRACCLWYRTEGARRCDDCSLWSEDEREERCAAMNLRVEGVTGEKATS